MISATCVVAHDSAATWMLNIFTGSPLLLSLMSTVAPAGFRSSMQGTSKRGFQASYLFVSNQER